VWLRNADASLNLNWRSEFSESDDAVLATLRFAQFLSAGADNIPFERISPNVVIASNIGAFAAPMAEHVLAMTLALAKRLILQNQQLEQGVFDQTTPSLALDGARVGIIGYGGIGTACARLFRSFGSRILAINTSGATDDPVAFVGTLDDLERVLRISDVVVLTLPLTRTTRGIIGPRELGWMHSNAILVNVSRGAIIDERALYEHLLANTAFQAAIDAWWAESPVTKPFEPAYPLLALPNLLGSPHNSWNVPGAVLDATRAAANNIARFLRGQEVRGIVRREDYSSVG
jgi:glycerate dehydrogenase